MSPVPSVATVVAQIFVRSAQESVKVGAVVARRSVVANGLRELGFAREPIERSLTDALASGLVRPLSSDLLEVVTAK